MRLVLISFIFFTSFFSKAHAQTLFTYGSEKVSKDEFLKAYNKNKNASVNQATALREYLDLYIRFKIKVKAAKAIKLDTLPDLVAEYKNFKAQIEQTYMDDDNAVDELVQEAFTRSLKDIHINHLFIPVNSPLPADTLKVYESVQKARLMLNEGKSFPSVSEALTQQGMNASAGDAGFITVFMLPYQLESVIYGLKNGAVSAPYRSKNGYYFFRHVDERKAAGKMRAAQILVSLPEGSNEEQKNRAKLFADSVYKLLSAGASFEEMAKAVSNDKMSYMAGGVMPEFGTGKYTSEFEAQAFALQKDGDISKPFLTPFGYHIVKRIARIPVFTDIKDATYLATLRQKVREDSRIQVANEKFNVQLLKKINYKPNPQFDLNKLLSLTDSFISGAENKTAISNISQKTSLHSFGSHTVRVGDWLKYAREYKSVSGEHNVGGYTQLFERFITQSAIDYYRDHLDFYNPEFKSQAQEFKDGNMLFEIMERNVWNKASADSAGLLNYYTRHKSKYAWEPSADAIVMTTATGKLALEISEQLHKGQGFRQVLEKYTTQLQYDSGRYELSQVPVIDRTNFQEGLITAPVINPVDSTASFAMILKLYPGNQPRSFEESRGLVINDYQAQLEEEWIVSLKKKYPVKVNEEVYATIAK